MVLVKLSWFNSLEEGTTVELQWTQIISLLTSRQTNIMGIRRCFSHSSHIFGLLVVQEYGNSDNTLTLIIKRETLWWGPQNCFGGSLQTDCVKRYYSFSLFPLLNLLPRSVAEACTNSHHSFCGILFINKEEIVKDIFFNPCQGKIKNLRYYLEKHLQLNLRIRSSQFLI